MSAKQCRGGWIGALLGLAMLACAALACHGTRTPAKDQVLRLTPVVWAGSPANNPPLLDHNNWTGLNQGDAIKTDHAGQAELQLDGCSGSLYVFKDGVLQVSPCLEEEQASGLATCVQVGTSYFNVECTSRFIVDTPSSRITVVGTAFSVTYDPERRLALVVVLEGSVTVQPVIDFSTGRLAPRGIRVGSGDFLYTTPGVESREIAGVRPRAAQPLAQLPSLVQELGIRPWIDDIEGRAEPDRLLPDNWPFQEVPLALAMDGGAFDDPRVQRAVLAAIDKDALVARAFSGREVQLQSSLGDEVINAREIPYDPDLAGVLLYEAGHPRGLPVFLLFPEGDASLARMAEGIARYLAQAGVEVELDPVSADELTVMVPRMREAGKAVMWLEQR